MHAWCMPFVSAFGIILARKRMPRQSQQCIHNPFNTACRGCILKAHKFSVCLLRARVRMLYVCGRHPSTKTIQDAPRTKHTRPAKMQTCNLKPCEAHTTCSLKVAMPLPKTHAASATKCKILADKHAHACWPFDTHNARTARAETQTQYAACTHVARMVYGFGRDSNLTNKCKQYA